MKLDLSLVFSLEKAWTSRRQVIISIESFLP